MHQSAFKKRPLATAIHLLLAVSCGAIVMADTAYAQSAASQELGTYQVDISAGSLTTALNAFANEIGVALSFDPQMTAGLHSSGVRGRVSVRQGFDALLQGSGLAANSVDDKTYTLKRVPAVPARTTESMLAPVTVTARNDDAVSEGTGSYAARAVTIGKARQALKDIPQSVTVLTRQFMDDQVITTMSDLMEKTPGVIVTKGDTAYQNFYSRGFRIDNYQIDGAGASYSASFRPNFDLAIYDRVEVLRGAEGLFSASGEPSGSVNLVRKRPTAHWQGSAMASTGSWNNHRAEADLSGPLAFDGRLRGRLVVAHQDREFFYSPSDEKRSTFYGVLETDLGPSTLLTAGLSYQKQRGTVWFNGLPRYIDGSDVGFSRRQAITTDWSNKDITIRELFATLEHGLNPDWNIKLQVARQEFDERNLYFLAQGPINAATGGFSQASASYGETGNHADSVDLNLTGGFEAWGRRHQVVVGADWRTSDAHQEGYYTSLDVYGDTVTLDNFSSLNFARPDILGPRSFYPAYGSRQKGLYGKLQLQATDALKLIVGGRYGHYDYSSKFYFYNADGSLNRSSLTGYKDHGIFTPYAGVVYDLNPEWSAYASITEVHKPQANYQKGPLDSPSPLDAIEGRNFEAGVKGALYGGALNAGIAFYRIERTGEAVQDPAYPITPGESGTSCCYLEQGKIVSQGIDTELSGQLARGWQMLAGYTYNQNRNKANGTVFSSVTPRHVLRLSTSYDLPGTLSAWTVGGGVTVQSKQVNSGLDWIYLPGGAGWIEEPFRIEQGGYAVWNAHVQHRITRNWSLALNVRNLFDRHYYQTLGTTRAGNWYGEPQNFTLTLRGSF